MQVPLHLRHYSHDFVALACKPPSHPARAGAPLSAWLPPQRAPGHIAAGVPLCPRHYRTLVDQGLRKHDAAVDIEQQRLLWLQQQRALDAGRLQVRQAAREGLQTAAAQARTRRRVRATISNSSGVLSAAGPVQCSELPGAWS